VLWRSPTRLELLAHEADVPAWWLRRYLRNRISEERRRLLFGSPDASLTMSTSGSDSFAVRCFDLAAGDPLEALWIASEARCRLQDGVPFSLLG
jgi:hypothetical protein